MQRKGSIGFNSSAFRESLKNGKAVDDADGYNDDDDGYDDDERMLYMSLYIYYVHYIWTYPSSLHTYIYP